MFSEADFKKDEGAEAGHAAGIIVDDMTVHFNEGLVIPRDAGRDWKG
jgi:hypothetical protein